MTPGGTSWVLVNGGSANKGLRRLVGETCAWRLAHGTTWVALETINPVQALLDTLLGYARGRLPIIRRLRDEATLLRDGPQSPLVPNFSRTAGGFIVGFPGNTAMVAQFGQATLASPPAPALRTGAAAARPILRETQCAIQQDATPIFHRRLGSVSVLCWASVILCIGV